MPFTGEPLTRWLDDNRRMVVLGRMTYTDAAGRVWVVEPGKITDGASIPRLLWTVVGSPFTGPYRVPALFHDQAYETLGVAKDAADRMLAEASLERGCEEWLAETLYEGVKRFGYQAYDAAQRRAAAMPNIRQLSDI